MLTKLQKISSSLPDIVQNDISNALDDGVTVAKSLARVRTGYMRDHISQNQQSKYTWNFVSTATYSTFQDEGTSRQEGTHFMEAGIKTAIPKAVLAIKEDLNALIK
jgi:HK97 gp10 family phage protein